MMQFERLEKIANLEDERALTMQKLEARIDAKMNMIKSEVMDIVAEDFQEKRSQINRDFAAKSRAKAAAGGAQAVEPTEQALDGEGEEEAAAAAQGGGTRLRGNRLLKSLLRDESADRGLRCDACGSVTKPTSTACFRMYDFVLEGGRRA